MEKKTGSLWNTMAEENIGEEFPILSKCLVETSKGLSLKGKGLIPKEPMAKRKIPLLRNYFIGPEIKEVIRHNLDWARGKKRKPKFKFAYLQLPTGCNQKCVGCFTGKDKGFLPKELTGKMYSPERIDEIIGFLKEHEAESVVYAGGGEFFTYDGAFDLIEKVNSAGLGMVIFTNGSLLSKKDVQRIASMEVSLIISLRDTMEKGHNKAVGINGFRKTLKTLEVALSQGMNRKKRLCVEIPVTQGNEKRVLYDFIPVMRSLGVVPLVEEFIQTTTSEEEKKLCHSFAQARKFFEKASQIDKKFGYHWKLEQGQRMVAQPKCKRALYSFALYPSGSIMDCVSHFVNYGNFYSKPLREIIYSKGFKKALLDFDLCACSVFYTKQNQMPTNLPQHLEVFT